MSLDGGHGGINFINDAGSADSQINAWFGRTAVQGGSGNNSIVGRKGSLVHVVKSPGVDTIFLSGIDPYRRVPHFKVAGFHLKKQDLGAFFKFVGNKPVKTGQPIDTLLKQNWKSPPARRVPRIEEALPDPSPGASSWERRRPDSNRRRRLRGLHREARYRVAWRCRRGRNGLAMPARPSPARLRAEDVTMPTALANPSVASTGEIAGN